MPGSKLENIDAVLLAGGRGQRLGSLTTSAPKPLVSIAGRSLLYRNLDQLTRFGVRRLVVVGGYRMSDLVEAVAEYAWNGPAPDVAWVKQEHVEAEGALLDGLIASTSERTLVRCADDLLEDATLSALVEARGAGAILTRPVPDAPLRRLIVASDEIRGTSTEPGDAIMTHNFCLDTDLALDWTRNAVRLEEPLVNTLDRQLARATILAVDGSATAGINSPGDIAAAEAWIETNQRSRS